MSGEGHKIGGRYVRTPGDVRARKRSREGRKTSIWVCPGCGERLLSPKGLSWHLVAVGPAIDNWACPAARDHYFGQTTLTFAKILPLEDWD